MIIVVGFKEKLFFYLYILFYITIMLNSIAFAKGSIIMMIVHGALLLYLCYYNFVHNPFWGRFLFIYIYLFFLIILIILSSSDYFYSFKLLIMLSEGLLCLPVAFGMFDNKLMINKMWYLLKIFTLLFVVNYLFANLLHWGGSMYTDIEGGETGNIEDEGHYLFVCFCAILPICFSELRHKQIWLIIVSFVSLLIVSTLKRTSIACVVTLLVVYLFCLILLHYRYHISFYKGVAAKQVMILFLTLFALASFTFYFQESIEKRYEYRSKKHFKKGLQKEGRVMELEYIYKDVVLDSDIKTFLLGRETFNTIGTYANGKFGKRIIHENYGIILNGSGVFGFFFYILIHLYMIVLFIRYNKRVDKSNNSVARRFYYAFVSLWCVFLVASFSGTIWNPLYSSMHFALTGIILRYFYECGETYDNYIRQDEIIL